MNRVTRYLNVNLISPVLLVALFILGGLFFYIPHATTKNTLDTQKKYSEDLITHMRIFRQYYTDKVINKIKANTTEIRINYDHDIKKDTIPLPATTIHDLGRLFTLGTESEVRMYSAYPFPNRKERVLDAYEKASLEYLLKHPNKAYIKNTTLNGIPVVRYAVADFMTSPACIECHNTRADTPKDDWRLGDMRGVIEVIAPINKELLANKELQENILFYVVLNIMILIIIFIYISIHNEKKLLDHTLELEDMVDETQERLRLTSSVYQNANEGIVICDPNTKIIACNPAFSNITGYKEKNIVGKPMSIVSSGRHTKEFYHEMWQSINQEGFWEGEIYNQKRNGTIYAEYLQINAIKDAEGHVTHYTGIFIDITRKKKDEESIFNLAHYDYLTNIPNRSYFKKNLITELKSASKEGHFIALLYIDLDRFKPINDTLGHNTGDKLLKSVANRIDKLCHADDFFARIGGDEFAIYIRSKRSIHECEQKAEQLATAILDAVSRPFNIENNQLSISASVGLALYPRDAKDYGELMQFADTAMYHAKDTGRNRHVFYFGEIVESAKHRFLIERELRNAIGNNEITLAYQPIVESGGDNVIEGFEVLSRWIHPELGFIPPDEFIKVAEETGLIGGYTLRLLDRACKKILHWNQLADKAFMLSINISPVHFLHDDLASSILETLEQNAFQPEHLKIEITENVLIENSDHVLKILNTLKKSGVKVSIDDFGTGYSSIGYLKSYPLDFIKIDRSFVIDTPINTDNKNICSVIKDLAGYMNLKVIAEGVENGENSRFLESIQIEYMQGYHFSKPMSAEFWDNYFL